MRHGRKGGKSIETINILIVLENLGGGILLILLSIPMLRGWVSMNPWYGTRFPQSFKSEANWYAINRYAATRLIFWSIPMLIIGVVAFFVTFEDNDLLLWVFTGAPLILVIPAADSFMFARKM